MLEHSSSQSLTQSKVAWVAAPPGKFSHKTEETQEKQPARLTDRPCTVRKASELMFCYFFSSVFGEPRNKTTSEQEHTTHHTPHILDTTITLV